MKYIKLMRKASASLHRLSLVDSILGMVLSSKIVESIRYRSFFDDRTYIEYKYMKEFGRKPNLDHPRTFNEKNNWRKLHDRQPIYTDMVDKYKLKSIVDLRTGAGHVFPLLGVWDSPDEIDYENLPNKFVLKPTHAGGVIVCKDKGSFDSSQANRELTRSLRRDYYIRLREWPYKDVQRRVIAEKYMGDNLTDYKNYCFNGKLALTLVWKNESRTDGRKPQAYFCGAYDRDWKRTSLELGYPSKPDYVDRPCRYDEMVAVSEAMSAGLPFVRVDCYAFEQGVFVGEMTFFPWGGFQRFKDDKWDLILGDMEVLPQRISADVVSSQLSAIQ